MPTFRLGHVLLLAFLVRLIVIPFFSDDFNYWANMTFTSTLLNGKNPWIVTYNDPCLFWINPWRVSPLQLPLLISPTIVNGQVGNYILTLFAMKLPLVLIDVLGIFFVYKILQMWFDDEKKNIRYLSIFAFNPISIISSAIIGSTDPIVTLFMIVSLFYFLKPTKNATTEKNISAIFLGLAIAAKLFPVVFIPVFLLKIKKAREKVTFAILSIFPIALFSLPFLIWDYSSYVNILLLHNIGGFHPFLTFLNPNLDVFLKTLVTIASIVMFGFAFFRKTDILINIVLAFLALYALMGFGYFDTKYFSWFIPFAVLLASRKEMKIPKSDVLPFIFIPSLVVFMIYNGPYNAVEGMTGFYYFAYHWLRQKVIIFQVLPFSDIMYLVAGIISALLIEYYFWMTVIRAPSISFPIIRFEKLEIIQNIKRHKKPLLALFLVALVSIVIFANVVPYETIGTGVDASNSTLLFYDDFSRSVLNPQWGVAGNGNYTVVYRDEPSYIRLNGNITLYRGWGPIWQGFKESSEAQVRLVYKLDDISQDVSKSSILVTNEGWFGIIKENKTYNFVYFDQRTNETVFKTPVDSQWHELRVYYHENDRSVSFDGELSAILSGEVFNYICLGIPIDSGVEMKGCSFSVDYVEVSVQNFYSSVAGEMYAFTALFVPYPVILYILFFISRRRSYLKKDPRQGAVS
jgi:hypothetical protein